MQGGQSYSPKRNFLVRICAQDIQKFAPGVLNICIICLFVSPFFLTMPYEERGAGFSNSDWPSGIAPKRQRANSVGTPEMPAEMRLIGKTRFGRHVYDREIFFWRRQ